jgi:hypothetical protein
LRKKEIDDDLNIKVYVYSLNDPDTNEIRYIGQTVNTRKRLYNHIYDALHPEYTVFENQIKDNWIRGLFSSEKKPTINVIEETNKKYRLVREQYWIDFYEDKNLTNSKKTLKDRIETISFMRNYLWKSLLRAAKEYNVQGELINPYLNMPREMIKAYYDSFVNDEYLPYEYGKEYFDCNKDAWEKALEIYRQPWISDTEEINTPKKKKKLKSRKKVVAKTNLLV